MINQNLGSYRITHLLGQGGMGAVYAAEHTLIGKRAAVKVLLPELSRDPEMVQRFFNEARSAAMIRHPGLVEIFDFGYHPDGQAYLVMEFLDGESLTSRLRRDGRLPVALAAGLCAQVAGAVGTAHAHGIVHRDLKPDNLFLMPDQAVAQRIRMKVLDFGIAKLVGDSGPDSLRTRTGALVGTPLYMSPEQCRGAGAIDHRSDIYSLGVILYEMIAGTRPFGGNGPGEVLAAHLFQEPAPLRAHDPNIPTAIEAVVMTCLAKDPAHRFQTMEMLAAALEASSSGVGAFMAPPANSPPPGGFVPTPSIPPPFVPGPATTLGSSAAQLAAPPPRRRSVLWIGLAAVVIAGGGAIGLWAARGGQTPNNPTTTTIPTTTTTTTTIETKPVPKPEPKPEPKPPEKIAPPSSDEACEPGHLEGCARLGLAYEMGRSKTRSFDSALAAYLRGCDAGSGEACAGLARLYLDGNGVRREPPRALAANRKACEARSAQGCYQLGDMYVLGINVPVDHVGGLAQYEKACELGSVGGCMHAGIKLVYALGVPPDTDKGKRLQQRALDIAPGACESGDVFACERLGLIYFRGYGVNVDAPRAVGQFQRACELGYAKACAGLGYLYENGRGIPIDRKRAFSLRSAACEGGYNYGCAGLGGQYLRGIGTDKDERRGLALLDAACEKGFGCGARAQAHLDGVGGPIDRTKALIAARRGCDAGDTNACTWVGELVPARKIEMNGRACDAADARGCLNLGVALARGSADDKKRSLAYFDKSCRLSGGEIGCNAPALASAPVKPEPRTKAKPPARVEPPRKVEAPPPVPDRYRTVEPPPTAEVYKPYVPPPTVRPPRGTVADKAEVDRWLAKAKEAARAGHWSNALGAVKEVLDRDPNNQEGIAIGGLAACSARNAIAARNYLARLGGKARALVRQVCVQNGLRVD